MEPTTFVLVPGAGGAGEVYWREVADLLRRRGHVAVPVEIAGDDPTLGLPEYARITDAAIADHRGVVLVAQSMGGFTVPMLARLDHVARVVLLNAMIPRPGETPGEWFAATGQEAAFTRAATAAGRPTSFDVETVFLHDIPSAVRTAMAEGDRDPADTPFGQPCDAPWPDLPTHVLVGADDRLFPSDFQRRVARDRLGLDVDVIPGGHLAAKSRPEAVTERLIAYASDPRTFVLDAAARDLLRVVDGVADGDLDRPTPCEAWAVQDLLAHLVMLVPAFTRTARHRAVPGPPPGPLPLPADWRERLRTDLRELVAAWKERTAWEGMADAGGVTMPSAELAVVVLDELVLHTTDLARATGQVARPTDRDVAVCTGFAAAVASAGGGGPGLFAAAFDVAPHADPLAALLALTGRDPAWRPTGGTVAG